MPIEAGIYTAAALEALSAIFTPIGLLVLFLGVLLGLSFGVSPGLGGPIAVALLIPLTFGIDSNLAFITITATIGGVAFGGSVSAILIGVPGTAANAATLLDGFPMAKSGKANVAIAASATSSALGSIVGIILFILLLPFLRNILRLFSYPEFFTITILGIVIISYVIRDALTKGIISGGIGMFLSFIGYSQITGGTRYTLGTTYLLNGVEIVVLVVGLFAIAEMIHLLTSKTRVSEEEVDQTGGRLEGITLTLKHYSILGMGSLVGFFIGLIPAAGGSVANFFTYSLSKAMVSDNSQFGKGDIRGVIAAEAANDAKDGGALIPTLTFGIPGSAVWAIVLGAMVLHGISVGPLVLTNHLDTVFIIAFTLIISNVLTSIMGIVFSDVLAKITMINSKILAPVIIIISLVGTYGINYQQLDMWLAVMFGFVGYLMMIYGFSRIALIIGFVLAPIAEDSFHTSLQLSGGSYGIFVTRPISAAFLAIAIIIIASAIAKHLRYHPTLVKIITK